MRKNRDTIEKEQESAVRCNESSLVRWDKSRSLILSRVMVYVFSVVLGIAVVMLPWLLKWYVDYMNKDTTLLLPLMVGLWLSAGFAYGALFCLERLLKNMARSRVFVTENVRYLRILSWCCFAVSALFFIFCVYYYILGAILAILAAFAGLIVRVVKNAFNKAVDLQQENDLTV